MAEVQQEYLLVDGRGCTLEWVLQTLFTSQSTTVRGLAMYIVREMSERAWLSDG